MCEDCLSQYSQIWHQYVIGRSLVCIFVCIFLCILVSIFVSVFVCIFVCILTHFQILIAGEFTSKQHKSWCGINNPQVAPWSSAAKSAVPLYYADRITEGGIKTLQVVPSTPADQISSALNYADRISKGGIKTLQVVSSTTADQISSAIELRRSYSRRRHQNPAGRSINHCRSDQQCNWTTQIWIPGAASKIRRLLHQTVSVRSPAHKNYTDLNTWGGIKNSQVAPLSSCRWDQQCTWTTQIWIPEEASKTRRSLRRAAAGGFFAQAARSVACFFRTCTLAWGHHPWPICTCT